MHDRGVPGGGSEGRDRKRRPAWPASRNGRLGEEIAALYLQLVGYEILARNARCGPLEVDLIARQGRTVAFVEVRMRSSRSHGRPEETVRWAKRRNILRAASVLLPRLGLPPETRARLDVIAVEREALGLRLRHLPGWMGPETR
ncbi:MAG: YraN family protein [Candidatus Eisenbacteria sp.]|nr:YraN family protein [Candidatus Eisenbacteria bacterium]